MGPLIGEDGVARCPWAGGAGVMRDYHDRSGATGSTGRRRTWSG